MPTFAITLSTAIEPILAARAGTIPCQPTPPSSSPGISWSLRGSTRASGLSTGTCTPWNRSGENSIHSPDQLISQPTTPVKSGMVRTCSQPDRPCTSVKNQSTWSVVTGPPLGGGYRGVTAHPAAGSRVTHLAPASQG